MLKAMRHHAKYFYVLFFIVILSFIFWGVGTVDKSEKSTIVAEVGSSKIAAEEYGRTYDRVFKFYRDLYKEKFDDEMLKKLKLKENVLNSLVESRVLLAAARKEGVSVSDEELNENIKSEPAFMKNGAFDADIYQNRLKLLRVTPEYYESSKRQELTVEKMRRLIELSAIIPDSFGNMAADDQTTKALTEALQNSAKSQALKSYIEGLKKGMTVKVYPDRIS
ncbi:MAG: SurA N-terminal domain-containing protein [Nitrospiraceae bacterium]|nr:SurA N-terminal domain-containing protein [Nitrospiraceae bacterium]